MRKALDYILKKLPDHSAEIIDLYNRDDDFRILCEDYLTSVQALEECRVNTIKDKELENEFSLVYLELEKEIVHLLNSRKLK
ncbi:MAG TPA: hypothetical protein VIZ28_10865 [Chitinophagaceae bacterium]